MVKQTPNRVYDEITKIKIIEENKKKNYDIINFLGNNANLMNL